MKLDDNMGKEESKLLVLLGYVIWIVAIVLYLVRKKSLKDFEKFHYLQATLIGIVGFILSFIPILGGYCGLSDMALLSLHWSKSIYGRGFKAFEKIC